MKISSQEEYGLRCLLRLARAEESRSLTIPEIAAAEGLSVPYAAKLLAVLRKAGILDSERGRAGGYRLARPAEHLGLGSILMVLGEPLFEEPAYCRQHAGTETGGVCVHRGGCTLRALWGSLEHWIRNALDQITLADLLQSEPRITELVRSRLARSSVEPPNAFVPLTLLNS